MATLTDQVIMPGSDYQAICDATRTLTGKTTTLKSGDVSTELGTVTPQGETWILGLVPSSSSGATGTFSAIFTSSYYSNLIFYGIKCSAITNGYEIEFYTNSEKTSTILPYSNGWGNDNIRKLTFKNPPTDAKFLSWLNVWQGEKQNTDLAVCLEDSITIHNTPYVYTPEHPYDGTKKLNITIPTETKTVALSMASGNQTVINTNGKLMTRVTVEKPSTLIPANIKSRVNVGGVIGGLMDFNSRLLASKNINDGVVSFTNQVLYHTLIAKNSINDSVFITGIVGGYINNNTFSTACHSYGSQYSDVSSTALVVSYNSSTQLYTYTWNVAESSSAYFYDCAIEVYGIQ